MIQVVKKEIGDSFNTVNGKYCCNLTKESRLLVGVVDPFQYRKR